MTERLCVGMIVGAHGVRGLVRVKPFTDVPEDVAAYGPLTDQAGARSFVLTPKNRSKGVLLCAIDGVDDRTAVEALKGVRLYADRSALEAVALEEDEFLAADLIGLAAEWPDGTALGTVRSVQDFGAGDVLEITLAAAPRSVVVPFTLACVPTIDLAAGRVVVDPPAGLLDGPGGLPKAASEGQDAEGGEDSR